jgi:sugar phosphate isomerase/epimerase
MTRLGVSTSALADRADLEPLLVYEPDVVEFYNYPSSLLPEVEGFCARHGIRPALHTPLPYDGPERLRRFAPTGPDRQEVAAAKRLVADTVRYAAEVNAVHVVVHFPSPYPPFAEEGFAAECADFLGWLGELSARHEVTVLIENLSANPLLRTARQYRDALADHPRLGFCLDLGHAHLLPPSPDREDPLGYARHLGRRIRSAHVYNTTAARYPEHGHELAEAAQTADAGYLELSAILPQLVRLCRPEVLVLEHAAGDHDPRTVKQTVEWIRGLISRTPEGREPGE